MGKKNSLARQLAGLPESAPQDFDPEEDGAAPSSEEGSNSQESGDERLGTEHYVEVSKSKLRKRDEIALGPLYAGSRVSREVLEEVGDETSESDYEDDHKSLETETFADPEASDMDVDDEDGEIDSDGAFGESDEEKFKDFTFRGSGTIKRWNGINRDKKSMARFKFHSDEESSGPELKDLSGMEDNGRLDEVSDPIADSRDSTESIEAETIEEDGESIETEDTSEASKSDEDSEGSDLSENREVADELEKSRRDELRKIMNEDQKTVTATIFQAVKADAEKGVAVRQQRKTFDSLLNVRIRLQKALVASNSILAAGEKYEMDSPPYQAAEEAAMKLLDTLDALRQDMSAPSRSTNPDGERKRKLEIDMPTSQIWNFLQESESTAIETRLFTLEKWSGRVRDVSARPLSSKLNNNPRQHTITDVMQEQLSNPERLMKRTKIPRSCAPLQAKLKTPEDPRIYDDADFYQLLLKELVDQRMMESSSASNSLGPGDKPIAQWTAVKEAKTRKNVDTKASKGRKMRYTVHEKLQNFMAPEDRGIWEQDATDRFFGTLLGQKMSLGEDEVEDHGSDDGEGAPLQEEALILFRS